MALKQTVTLSGPSFVQSGGALVATGSPATVALPLYIRVTNVAGDKHQQVATVSVIDDSTKSTIRHEMITFSPDMAGPNFIAQAYEHLKTLPQFAEAEDC